MSHHAHIVLQSAADHCANTVESQKDAQEGWRLTGEERNCIQMFRTSEYEQHKARNPDPEDRTCQWFLRHPKFHNWRESRTSSLLWVSADPGCGKSVLAKSLLERELLSTTSRTTCYFFFKDDDVDQKSGTKALCALIHQLFSQNNALVKYAIPDFRHEGSNLPQLFGKLWSILTKAAADPEAGDVICVLDALDECEESNRFELIDTLHKFYRGTGDKRDNATLKFLVTSRPYFDIERGFKELTTNLLTIQLAGKEETRSIRHEIDIVIKARVQKIAKKLLLDDSERLSLQEDFLNIIHRTYLWVKLIFEVIEQRLAVTKKRLRGIIGTIPDTLDKAYEAILERSTDKIQAKKLLHIIVSAVRPLTLREMNIALTISEGNRSEEDLDLEPEDRFRITVRNLCGLFVSVIDSKIYLIHQTAKEFLVKNDTIQSSSLGAWKHSLEPRESNFVLAEICIFYLLFTEFESNPLIIDNGVQQREVSSHVNRYASRHGLLNYSAKHWGAHFRIAKVTDWAIVDLALEVCNSRSKRFLTWFQVYWMTVNSVSQCPQSLNDLMVGSYFGLEAVVRLRLKNGVDVNAKDKDSLAALDRAAENGHEAVVRMLLENKADVKTKDKDGWTALHRAATNGHEAVVRVLLENGADVNAKNKDGWTALYGAAWNGHEAVVRLLLENRADVKTKDEDSLTALHWAAANGHEAAVQLLLENGADVKARDEDGWKALHWAAENGHEAVVRILLENRADVNAKNKDGWTALHWAAANRHEAVVRLLLENRADVKAKDKDRWTALHWAAENGHEAMLRLLLENGDVNAKNKDGWTALHWAAENGHQAVAQLLLENRADVNAKDKDGLTALHRAARNRRKIVVQLLLKEGADINARDKDGLTTLYWAAQNRDKAMMWLLLENRADIEAKDEDGWTVLDRAAWKGHEEVVRLLLENKADVKMKDEDGWTALHRAAANGHEAVVQLLLENGAAVKAEDEDGWTALHRAAWNGHDAVVRLLLEHRADVKTKDKDGWTVLHRAAWNGHDVVVQLLLENRADVKTKDEDGWTVLHRAARNGHEAVARLLLEHGADVNATTGSKWTALHWAAGNGHEAIVQLLLENGADVKARDEDGLKALHQTAGNGQKAVAKLLLAEDGIDTEHCRSPLPWAAEKGHEAVVKLRHAKDFFLDESELVHSYESLIADHLAYQYANNPRSYFTPGKVFMTPYTEPAGPSAPESGNITHVPFGQRAFTEIRRFVVIQDKPTHCLALPIHTHRGRGDQKFTTRPQDRCPVFAVEPSGADGSHGWDRSRLLKNEIPIVLEDDRISIDYPNSLIDVSKIYCIEHYALVRTVGHVRKDAVSFLKDHLYKSFGRVEYQKGKASSTVSDVGAETFSGPTPQRLISKISNLKGPEDSFLCDYPDCRRHHQPFSRQTQYRDHLRDYHKEDILPQKRKGALAQEKWFADRRLDAYWWRCHSCLSRVHVGDVDDGFRCPNCNSPLEIEREMYRKKALHQHSIKMQC